MKDTQVIERKEKAISVTFVANVFKEGVGFVGDMGARREGGGCCSCRREDGRSGRETKTARVEGQVSEKVCIHGCVVFVFLLRCQVTKSTTKLMMF